MDEIVGALADQHAELSSLLADLDEADWHRPSRCEGWTVSDVVLHLAQTDEMALASATGRFAEFINEVAGNIGPARSIDDGVDLMVANERDQPGHTIRDRWRAGAVSLCQVLAACNPQERVVWVAGELSARTLATTRLAETWIHTGDVAAPFDVIPAPTDRLWHIARLAWRTLPYAFASAGRELAGPVAFELQAPDGQPWSFVPDQAPVTVIRGDAHDLCLVAGRRIGPSGTSLRGHGPDASAVLELVRTYA